ncbi:site-2 protease family protein [Candidatus Microgenomates bacterium]|nr:site-2 protease family protein [Candidatus Microgenomates bacterium]
MELLIGLIILIFSAILHEVAHGFAADRLGDPTARLAGRLTLNPIPHIDPFMSILLPLLLMFSGSPIIFGAAKPVPIDPFNLKEGKKDIALTALAGPATNIAIAIVAALAIKLLTSNFLLPASSLYPLLSTIVFYNLLLAVLNLIPIPPLDGSKVFAFLLPDREAAAYLSLGGIGIFILFFLLLFPIGGISLGKIIFDIVSFGMKVLG